MLRGRTMPVGRNGPDGDRSCGYEAMAAEFMRHRHRSQTGVATVRSWARSLPRGAAIVDLGCGSGVPIAQALTRDGFAVFGIDASPTLVAAFRETLPHAEVACEAVEDSRLFGRTFDGAIAVGLMFLLAPSEQRTLIGKVGRALSVGGRFLFTAPLEACTWTDVLTGRASHSLGAQEYRSILSSFGFEVSGEDDDEGGNHYYDARLVATPAPPAV